MPLTAEAAAGLWAGQRVLLSGVVFTARDAAHRRMIELLEAGEEPPFPLRDQVIYYTGPSPARPGAVIGSAGPTTATRMDAFTIPLLERGLRGTIGKGYRSAEVREAMRTHGAVYFAAVGGAAALLARRIVEAEVIAYPDLGTEAVRRLLVDDFPVVVANDTAGGDIFELQRGAPPTAPGENRPPNMDLGAPGDESPPPADGAP
ncbi:MAG: FumA C-terminus/TtdB family hydratase beta subunit [Gemmatimonadota bacterium]